jgi:hydrogenase/urease accessory protein HupE
MTSKYRVPTLFPLFFFLFCISLSQECVADTVKPALIEINTHSTGQVTIEIRASIEALLTGINGRYKNTKEAPNAAQYDTLRKYKSDQLAIEFKQFHAVFLQKITLKDNKNKNISLKITGIDIPEAGYTKVPRISVINLSAQLDKETQSLQWYYPLEFGDNAVRLRQINEAEKQWHWSEWQWLRKDQPSTPFSLLEVFTQRPLHQVIIEYIVIGFEHILPKGLDHILFILGIFLLNTQFKPLVQQVTLFTIAHTITLGLAINGIISLPAYIVEPLIALSIAYVGIENILATKLNNTRLLVVFLFGLLHGMGFASVLADFNMPEQTFITTLISFNIGVELGQLTIIALAYFSLSHWFKKKSWYRNRIVIPSSLFISSVGFYWAIERLNLL